jgi:hypothetical protein
VVRCTHCSYPCICARAQSLSDVASFVWSRDMNSCTLGPLWVLEVETINSQLWITARGTGLVCLDSEKPGYHLRNSTYPNILCRLLMQSISACFSLFWCGIVGQLHLMIPELRARAMDPGWDVGCQLSGRQVLPW